MSALYSLPARPSLESLRKQAKKLARDAAAADAPTRARVRALAPNVPLPLSQRDAQLVVAREYGFAGWHDLRAEVLKRLGRGLEWAAAEAERAVHDNDIARLRQIVAEYPGLLSSADLLRNAAASFGDSFDPFREQHFTRRACVEFLLEAGAVVSPSIIDGLVLARARVLVRLFNDKGLLPQTLRNLAALGDLAGVRTQLAASHRGDVEAAFICASRFEHVEVAALLLGHCIALDPALGEHLDGSEGRAAFIRYFGKHPEDLTEIAAESEAITPWRAYVLHEALHAVASGNRESLAKLFATEPWLASEANVRLQVDLFERAVVSNQPAMLAELIELDPGLLRRQPPPPSAVLEYLFEYGHAATFVPLVTRIWSLPNDLPTDAGLGDLTRVQRWFDASGRLVLGNLDAHYPANNPRKRSHLHWGAPNAQQVLDTALAWACLNRHLDVAAFLIERGADVNTTWSSHEPASILHELAFHDNREAMQFLIDRGIDLTTRDWRWNATAEGWALHAAGKVELAEFLAKASRTRQG
jgi:hypothetical protein